MVQYFPYSAVFLPEERKPRIKGLAAAFGRIDHEAVHAAVHVTLRADRPHKLFQNFDRRMKRPEELEILARSFASADRFRLHGGKQRQIVGVERLDLCGITRLQRRIPAGEIFLCDVRVHTRSIRKEPVGSKISCRCIL